MSYVFAPPPVTAVPVAGGGSFPVHRVYCVGRNYAAHAKEMGGTGREAPFFFMKPADAALVASPGTTTPLPYPSLTHDLHHEIELVVAIGVGGRDIAVASSPTIRRYLKAHGMFRKAAPKRATAGAIAARDRLEQLEVRSFELDHVNALWHLDFHHGSRKVLTRKGLWVTPMLLGVIDDRSRLVCHLQWYLDETP